MYIYTYIIVESNKSRVGHKREKIRVDEEERSDDVYYRVVSPPPWARGRVVLLCRRAVGLNENLWGAHNGISVGRWRWCRRRRRVAAVSGPCVPPPPPPNVSFNERPRPVQGGDDVSGGSSSDVGDGGIAVLPTSPSYEDHCRWYRLRRRGAALVHPYT
ncbi:unnamed protein product [Aphis gossypii]|uniref:Uncharacterized protein n=1 Tax=Aphis gossypii TaxID=80765 RepID=A0A9P0ND25_APHGO|nr:unnamed protein product [Aphis gossypii]